MRAGKLIATIFMILGLAVLELAVLPPEARSVTPGNQRLALVIGNAQYHDKPLTTAVNDAALVAETLIAAGFDVTGTADLDRESMRRVVKDFQAKAAGAGPNAAVFVYFAGYGLQYAGDNYLIPIDAALLHDNDIPAEAIKLSDVTRPFAALAQQAHIFVADAARDNVFPTVGGALALGLALPDVDPGSLIAFNAAPGTIAPPEKGTYGGYAMALAETLRYGGMPADELFVRARLRANEMSRGAAVPWSLSKVSRPVVFLGATGGANSPLESLEPYEALRGEPLHDFIDPAEAYSAAVALDTLSSYQEFLSAFPEDPLNGRVMDLLARRREALTWNMAHHVNKPGAYWSYMRRYPDGPHAADAQRLLASAQAPANPPGRFEPYDFLGLAGPSEEERGIVNHMPFEKGGPVYAPVPAASDHFLPRQPGEFKRLATPEPRAPGLLPSAAVVPLTYARAAEHQGRLLPVNLDSPGAPANGVMGETAGAAPLPGQGPATENQAESDPGHGSGTGSEPANPRAGGAGGVAGASGGVVGGYIRSGELPPPRSREGRRPLTGDRSVEPEAMERPLADRPVQKRGETRRAVRAAVDSDSVGPPHPDGGAPGGGD